MIGILTLMDDLFIPVVCYTVEMITIRASVSIFACAFEGFCRAPSFCLFSQLLIICTSVETISSTLRGKSKLQSKMAKVIS